MTKLEEFFDNTKAAIKEDENNLDVMVMFGVNFKSGKVVSNFYGESNETFIFLNYLKNIGLDRTIVEFVKNIETDDKNILELKKQIKELEEKENKTMEC